MRNLVLWALLLCAVTTVAQDMPKAKPAEIPFQVIPDFLKIPKGMIMAEAVGVAIN